MKKIIIFILATFFLTASAHAQIIQSQSVTYVDKTYPCYQGEANAAYVVTPVSTVLETIHGVRINKYLFIGGGIGAQWIHDLSKDELDMSVALNLPIFANIKGYYPINDKIAPFLNLSLGGAIVLGYGHGHVSETNGRLYDSFVPNGGFYCDFGAGIKLNKFTIGLGMINNSFNLNYHNGADRDTPFSKVSFYFKIGLQW